MCFARGDPRTADYTARHVVRASAPATNDNLPCPRATSPSRERSTAFTNRCSTWLFAQARLEVGAVAALVTISGGLWLAVHFAPIMP